MKSCLKKLMCVVLSAALLLSFAACSNKNSNDSQTESSLSSQNGKTNPKKENDETKNKEETKSQKEFSSVSSAENTQTSASSSQTTAAAFEMSEYHEKTDFENASQAKLIGGYFQILSLGESDGVMCATIQNISNIDFEYCVLTAQTEKKSAVFVVSAFPAGEKGIIFEKNGQKYSKSFLDADWQIQSELKAEESFDLHSDAFELSLSDGCLEIKNISENNIEGTVYVCYKNTVSGLVNAGTSYRMKIGGIESGETKQLFSKNVKKTSKVIYISYDG